MEMSRVPRLVFGSDHPSPVDLGDLLHHKQGLAIKVDVFPAQAYCLAAAHPGDQEQVVEFYEPVVGVRCVPQEDLALLGGPRLGSLGVLRRQLNVVRRAVRDEPALDRGVESRAQDGMDAPDGAGAEGRPRRPRAIAGYMRSRW